MSDMNAVESILAVQNVEMGYMKGKISSIEQKVDNYSAGIQEEIKSLRKDMFEKFATKDEVQWLRNTLIGGILLTIFLGVLVRYFHI